MKTHPMMVPKQTPFSRKEQSRFLRMIGKYFKPYAGWLLLLFLVYATYTFFAAVQPLFLAPILDVTLNAGGQVPVEPVSDFASIDLNNIGQYIRSILGLGELSSYQTILILGLAYLGSAIGMAVFNFANYLLAIRIKIGIGRDIQVDLFKHLFGLSLDFFNNERIGEIVARLDQDTKNAVGGIELALRNLFVSPILIVYYGYLLVVTNVNLTIFVVVAALLNYGLTQLLRNPIRRRMMDQVNVDAEVTAYLQERLSNARVVKTFVAEVIEALHLRKLAKEVLRVNMRFGFYKHLDEPVTGIISAAINVGILLFSVSELLSGRLSTTGFLLYLFIGRSILVPLTTLTQTYNSIQSTMATGVRVRELFNIKPSVVSGTKEIKGFDKSITFADVSFRYEDQPVIQNVTFQIRKGQTTALVGPSGAGKSTITDLMLRFYDPDSGKVLIDGFDLREYDLPQIRKLFGVVAQENILFNATIAENISYGRLELTQEDIEDAALIANAHEFILELPQGYDTYVGDRGVRLSGGQRQRIAIARAIAHRPQILILDEATSSLDTESEQRVQIGVDRAVQSTTAVVIAHRLSTVIGADQIVVIDGGRVVDKGTHLGLMERCTLYKNLAALQFNPKRGIAQDETNLREAI